MTAQVSIYSDTDHMSRQVYMRAMVSMRDTLRVTQLVDPRVLHDLRDGVQAARMVSESLMQTIMDELAEVIAPQVAAGVAEALSGRSQADRSAEEIAARVASRNDSRYIAGFDLAAGPDSSALTLRGDSFVIHEPAPVRPPFGISNAQVQAGIFSATVAQLNDAIRSTPFSIGLRITPPTILDEEDDEAAQEPEPPEPQAAPNLLSPRQRLLMTDDQG